jgi:hypothetical protein
MPKRAAFPVMNRFHHQPSLKQLARELDLPVVFLSGRSQADGVEPNLTICVIVVPSNRTQTLSFAPRDVGKNRTDDESEREKNNIQETRSSWPRTETVKPVYSPCFCQQHCSL